jgi:hypothetical protein
MRNKTVIRITIFYILAIGISNIFRLHLFGYSDFEKQLSEIALIATYPLQAVGIMIGSIIAIHLMKKTKSPQYSLFGDSVFLSIALTLIPIILVGIIGFNNAAGINSHIKGLLAVTSTLLYCYFEEFGWRGYLNDELKNLRRWKRVLLIGFLWWFWHLSFINNQDLLENLIFLILLLGAAWGLGILIEQTKSVLVVSSAHMIINILFLNSAFRQGMLMNSRLIVVGISVILYIILIVLWEKEKERNIV